MGITDKDNGYRDVRKSLFEDADSQLEVGMLGYAALEQYENGVAVWEAAMWAEFGTQHAPSRSWLRGWFDENRDLVVFWLKGEMLLVAQGVQTKQQALDNVGRKCVHSVKQRILQGIPPENATSTVLKKGFSFPLFNTGKFINAIAHRISRRVASGR